MDASRELSGREMPSAGECGNRFCESVFPPQGCITAEGPLCSRDELRMPVRTVVDPPRIGYAAGTPTGPRPALVCRPIIMWCDPASLHRSRP